MLALAVCFAFAPVPGTPSIHGAFGVTQAVAQEQKKNLLDFIFKRKKAAPQIQQVPKKKTVTKPAAKKKTVVRKKAPVRKKAVVRKNTAPKKAVAAAAPAAPEIEKIENANRILVIGDFIADGMSQGLEDAFADVSTVVIEKRTNGSSGLVRDDFYNWTAEIGPIIEEVKPRLVVAMLGSNDRQEMRIDGRTEAVRSEAWDAEYVRRVNAFAQAVRATNTRLVWVGSPPFRFRSMSADILAFNAIYQNAAESTDGYFVDIWDGFVDEAGNYIQVGADVKGQQVRLRASDGINFTTAGKRKIAFYVEQQLKQLLGDAASPLLTSLANESAPLMRLPPLQTEAELDRTNPISVEDPDFDGGGVLLGDIAEEVSEVDNPLLAKSVRQRLVEDGVPPPSKPGRADDFSWPADG